VRNFGLGHVGIWKVYFIGGRRERVTGEARRNIEMKEISCDNHRNFLEKFPSD
jgi:hypothetical protein